MRFHKAGCAATVAVAVWCGSVVPSTQAAVVLDGRSSISDAYGEVDSPTFFDYDEDWDTRSFTGSGPFTYNAGALAEAFGGEAEANTEHSSNVTVTNGSLTAVDMTGYVDVSALASQGVFSWAEALSRTIVRFTVPAGETADFTLSGNLYDGGDRTVVQVYLSDVTDPLDERDVVFRSGNIGTFENTGTLEAGQYELGITAYGLGTESSQGFGDAQLEAHLALESSAIPEPASVALLAAPVALLLRRRRRV